MHHYISQLFADSLPCVIASLLGAMAFALTTGQEWVFGVVDMTVPGNIRCIKTSRAFGIGLVPSLATIKSMLKLILSWVSVIGVISGQAFI